MSYMFSGCSGLTSLDVSNFNTSSVTDMRSMFSGCSGLTSLDVTNFNTSNVTDMGGMFSGCSGLTSLDVSNFNTSSVTGMTHMFNECSGLTSLDVSGFDTSSVTDMSSMFGSCSSVTSLDVSGFDTSRVTDMSFMFSGCSGLTSLDVSKWNTSSVTDMRSMFYYCSSLTSLDVSKWNTSSVTDMRSMFYYCSNLTSLDVSNWNTSGVKDIYSIFENCGSLENLDVSNWDTSNVTALSRAFYYCSNLTILDVSKWVVTPTTGTIGVFWGCSSLRTLDLSGWDTTNVTTMNHMFSSCNKLETIILGPNFDKMNGLNMFSGCSSLSKIISHRAASESGEAIKLGESATIAMPTGASLYVPDELSEESYEAADNYRDVFTHANDTADDLVRVESFFNLVGKKEMTVAKGLNFIDPGVTVFGYSNLTDATNYEAMGYTVEVTGNDFSTANEGEHTVQYTLKYATPLTSGEIASGETPNAPVEVATIERKVIVAVLPILGSRANTNYALGWTDTYAASSILSVTIQTSIPANIADMIHSDISADGTTAGSVMTWIVPSGDEGYNQYIGANSDVIVASTGRNLFSNYSACTSITGLDILDTSSVTNMSFMFNGCSGLTSLDVGNWNTSRVTNVGTMFWDCSNLTSLDVSSWNTNSVTDMSFMFYGCSGLTSLDVSNWNTSRVTNVRAMFWNCSNLTSLDVSSWNTSSVTNMSEIFYNCEKLTSLDVKSWDTSRVTTMRFMFYYCSNLTSLDVSNWNTSSVTDMGGMFTYCSSLTSLDVSNFNTSNVTDMGSMFTYCSSLTSLDVSNFNTSNVTEMGSMFNLCSGLTSLDVSKWNTSSVTDMGYMFSGCSGVTSLDVTNFNTSNVTDMGSMFSGCSKLETIILGKDFDRLNGQHMFLYCSALTKIISHRAASESGEAIKLGERATIAMPTGVTLYVPDELSEDSYEAADNYRDVFTHANDTADDLVRVESFYKLAGEETMIVPVGGKFKDPGVKIFGYSSLTEAAIYEAMGYSVEISGNDFSTSEENDFVVTYTFKYLESGETTAATVATLERNINVRIITPILGARESTSYALGWKSTYTDDSILSVTFQNSIPDLTDMIHADVSLNQDESIMTWLVPNGTKYDQYIGGVCGDTIVASTGERLFSGYWACTSITGLNYLDTSSVTNMSNMFSSCVTLTSLDVRGFDTSNVTDMNYMFWQCKKLTSLDVSGWNTSCVTNMNSMFSLCDNLTNLDVSNFNTSSVTNMASMFDSCKSLTSLDLRNFDLSALDNSKPSNSYDVNHSYMFDSCSNLKSIIISDKFLRLDGYQMFRNCTKLRAIIIDTPITSSENALTLSGADEITDENGNTISGPTGLADLPNAILYVHNEVTEKAYEDADNYLTVFGANRIRPILGLKGDNPAKVAVGKEYTDKGASVAGFSADYEIIRAYGYEITDVTITQNGIEVGAPDTSTAGGSFDVTYTLSYTKPAESGEVANGPEELMSVTRNVVIYEVPPMLMAEDIMSVGEGYIFKNTNITQTRSDVLTITIQDTMDAPSGTIIDYWDVSKYRDGSVLACLVDDPTDSGNACHLYIGSKGKIEVSDGFALFANYSNCTEIKGLENLNTSKVESMTYMFAYCTSLESIDLSGFDTTGLVGSNLNTFGAAMGLEGIDTFLSGTEFMFDGCTNLRAMVLGENFHDIDISMINNCTNLTSVITKSTELGESKNLKVGDYVNYTASSGTYTVGDSSLFTAGQTISTEHVAWKVLSIDNETGEVLLTPEGAVNVGITQNDSYYTVNAKQEMDMICDELYSNDALGVNARSLTYEELNTLLGYDTVGGTEYKVAIYPAGTVVEGEIEYNGEIYTKAALGANFVFHVYDGGGYETVDQFGNKCAIPTEDDPVFISLSPLTAEVLMGEGYLQIPVLEYGQEMPGVLLKYISSSNALGHLNILFEENPNYKGEFLPSTTSIPVEDEGIVVSSTFVSFNIVEQHIEFVSSMLMGGYENDEEFGYGIIQSNDYTSFIQSGMVGLRPVVSVDISQIDVAEASKDGNTVATAYSIGSGSAGHKEGLTAGIFSSVFLSNMGTLYIPDVTLYVLNEEIEAKFETDPIYAEFFGTERIQPVLELVGTTPAYVKVGETYVDSGVTVGGFTEEDSDIYTKFGYEVTTEITNEDGAIVDSVDTSEVEKYEIKYILDYTDLTLESGEAEKEFVMDVARDVEVLPLDMTYTSTGYTGVYDGEAHGITVSVTEPSNATIYYSETKFIGDNYSTGSTEPLTRTNAGETTVYYYIVADNYNSVSGEEKITISKQKVNAPTNAVFSPGGILTFTESSNATGYAISFDNAEWEAVYNNKDFGGIEVFDQAGTYTLYLKAINDDADNYIESDILEFDTIVHEILINSNNESMGTVSDGDYYAIEGATYRVDGTSLIIEGITTGTEKRVLQTIEATAKQGYTFNGWSSNSGTITENITITANFSANELSFENQTIDLVFDTEAQTANVTPATNGTGNYTYAEVSEKIKGGDETNYISLAGTVLTIAANTPAGTYEFVIEATDIGSGVKAQATYTIKVEQAKGSIRYETTSMSKTYGTDPFTNPLTKTGDGSLTYASLNEEVATVNEVTGEVTIVGAGEATITATVADGANYTYPVNTASYILTVNKASAEISFTNAEVDKVYGDEDFTVTVVNTGDGKVTYASSNKDVATVNETTGEVTILKAGSTTITATVVDGTNYTYATKTASYKLEVAKKAAEISFADAEVDKVYGDANFTVTVVNTGDGKVTYASSNKDVATVNEATGEVTILKAGSTTITATVVDGTNYTYATKTASYKLEVAKKAAEISFADAEVDKVYGDEDFTVTVTNTGDGKVTYTSSNKDVATVNEATGEVTILKAGNTTITATVVDGTNYTYATKTASYKLEVAKKAAEISFTDAEVDKVYGDENFIITVVNTGDGKVTYASSNKDVATVNATTGEVTIVGAGNTTITATVADSTNYTYPVNTASYELVVNKKLPTLTVTPSSITVVEGNKAEVSVQCSGDGNLTATSSATEVVTARAEDGKVILTGIASGTASVTVKVSEGDNYLANEATINVTVIAKKYSVDGTFFATIEEAANAITGTGTIKVETTNTDGSTFNVTNGKDITIDTSDKTIIRTATMTVENGGKLSITGSGVITTAAAIDLITNNGELTVLSDSTVTLSNTNAGEYAVISNRGSGIATILSGNISGAHTGIYNAGSGKFVIGDSSNAVDTGKPIIIGKKYGYSESTATGTLEFYDGVFKGQVTAISRMDGSSNIVLPDGYGICRDTQTIDGLKYKVEFLSNDANYTDGTYLYDSLESAIEEVENRATITARKDVIDTSNVYISEDKTITLDLGGHTITLNEMIESEGRLTIIGTGDSKLDVNADVAVMNNSGALIIGTEEGAISNSPVIEGNKYAIAGNFTMSGGTLIGSNEPPYGGGSVTITRGFADIVVEKVGNVYHARIEVESNPPVIKVIQNIETPTNTDVILVVSAKDTQSGVKYVEYTLNGETHRILDGDGQVSITVKENGVYEFVAVDNLGNEAELKHTVSNIDREALEIEKVSVTNAVNGIVTTPVIILGGLDFDDDDANAIFITNNENISPFANDKNWIPYYDGFETPWVVDTSDGNGEKNIYVWVKDEANNICEKPYIVTVTLDTNLIGGGSNEVVITIAGVDKNFGKSTLTLGNIEFTTDSGNVTYQNGELRVIDYDYAYQALTGEQYRITLSNVNGGGELHVTLPAGSLEDKAGNTNEEVTIKTDKVLDTNAPTINIVDGKIEVTDLEDNLIAVVINDKVVTATDGYYGELTEDCEIKAYDKAGNIFTKTYDI